MKIQCNDKLSKQMKKEKLNAKDYLIDRLEDIGTTQYFMASTPIKNENGNDDTMNGNGDANNVSNTKRKDVVNDSTNNRRTLSAVEEDIVNGEYPNNTRSDAKSQLCQLLLNQTWCPQVSVTGIEGILDLKGGNV